jgi:hypothetical protein
MRSSFTSEQVVTPWLETFETVSLEGLDRVELQNRVDVKYIFHFDELSALLSEFSSFYNVLEIDNRRIFNYDTLYFDTPDFDLYKMHHNGKPNRMKIRYRSYADSGEVFFEIKYKLKGTRTLKKRYRRESFSQELSDSDLSKIRPGEDNFVLQKKIRTIFKRITLGSKSLNERITIDLDLKFSNHQSFIHYPQLIIAEVKQNKGSVLSPAISALKKRHYAQAGFSKYCTGVSLLENIKHNAFKPKLIKLNKIIHGDY